VGEVIDAICGFACDFRFFIAYQKLERLAIEQIGTTHREQH
jgi:hypothetical protein